MCPRNQLSAHKTTPNLLTFGIQRTKIQFITRHQKENIMFCTEFIIYLKLQENSIFRIKCGKAYFNARTSRDSLARLNTFRTWYERFFLFAICRNLALLVSFCVRKVDFSAHLKFYCTSVEKSTLRTQNDINKAKFRCTTDTKLF